MRVTGGDVVVGLSVLTMFLGAYCWVAAIAPQAHAQGLRKGEEQPRTEVTFENSSSVPIDVLWVFPGWEEGEVAIPPGESSVARSDEAYPLRLRDFRTRRLLKSIAAGRVGDVVVATDEEVKVIRPAESMSSTGSLSQNLLAAAGPAPAPLEAFLRSFAQGKINAAMIHDSARFIQFVGPQAMVMGKAELLQVVQTTAAMGGKPEVLEFKVLSQYRSGNMISVVSWHKSRVRVGTSETTGEVLSHDVVLEQGGRYLMVFSLGRQ